MTTPDTGRTSPTFGKLATQDSDFTMKGVAESSEETKTDISNSSSPIHVMKRASTSEVPNMSKSASDLGVAHHKVHKGAERPKMDEIMEQVKLTGEVNASNNME